VEIGVVLNLVSSDLFECERGKGAKHGGKELKTSSKTALKDVTTSVYLKSGYHIIPKFSKVRGMGAVALELAHVAAGGIDCLLDNRGYLKVTDVAAGALLVEEAGGKISDSQGNNLNQSITRLEKVSILASGNPKLHKNILSEVGRG
jgi:myo-inositol-1(or 4)-monophosphatase